MSTTTKEQNMSCPECGQAPMGTACYYICPNSVHYYSPEQERYDDATYHDDYARECGYDDLDALAEADEQDCCERDGVPYVSYVAPSLNASLSNDDDLPF